MSPAPAPDPWEVVRTLPMGQRIRILRNGTPLVEGTLVPSSAFSGDRIVQIKLESGYNSGIRLEPNDEFEVIGELPAKAIPLTADEGTMSRDHRSAPTGPWIALLTTGGTIASRIDYRTGGVRPVKDEEQILAFYPDLDRDGPIRITPVFDRLSENLVPQDWEALARHVVEVFHEGAKGVVIAHGTDTLGFTAAGLSFLLEDLPGPVVLTGAQRSPDRPSSDGVSNLHSAVRLARHPRLAEVVVVMHDGLSDDRFAIHRGTRVRKMHSSRRDAFRSLNGPPIGFVQPGGIELGAPFRERSGGPARFAGPLGLDAGLLWSYPGLEADRARAFVQQLRGVVLAGTGLGHIASVHLPWIAESTAKGIVVVMTTQCLEGNVDPFVYETGRELVKAGVLYVRDMLPEVAYAKLLWALGRSRDRSEVHFLMLKDRAGELSDRHEARESS